MMRRRTVYVLAGAALAAVPIVPGWTGARSRVPAAVVREGEFADTIVEAGTLASAQMNTYGAPSAVTHAKIAELIAEGTQVRAGDRLIRFDTAQLEAERAHEEATLRAALAERLRAREELRVEQMRGDSDASSARDRVGFAEQALANATDGQGQLDLAEARAAGDDARHEVERARRAYDDLAPLLADGFITRAELEKAGQTLARAQSAAALAELRVRTLTDFQHPAAVAKTKAELGAARDGLGRVRDTASARRQQAQATAALAESRVGESQSRLDALDAALAASIVDARQPGLVIYRDLFFGADRRKPQVGDEVAANQVLLAVPDTSRLIVESRIREVDVRKIATGRRLTVRVDAYPDLSVSATVQAIGALALEDPSRGGARFFPMTIAVDVADPRLRPGMSVRAELPANAVRGAHIVPLAAVLDADGEPYCVVLDGSRRVRRRVSVIGTNDTEAAVKGVDVGERLALSEDQAPVTRAGIR